VPVVLRLALGFLVLDLPDQLALGLGDRLVELPARGLRDDRRVPGQVG
jgi:hypothetical protein